MNNPHLGQRIKKIQTFIRHKKVQCLLLVNPANVTYATGFMGKDSWAMVTPHEVILLTDDRYTEQAKKECVHCRILPRSGSMVQLVANLCKRRRHLKTLHIEDSITWASLSAIKKAVSVSIKTSTSIESL